MKLLEVNIDRFGQFYKWSCSFSDAGFLTVFGPNEAGKSTLVAFIKCIFFGFPRKSELEPYTSGGEHQNDLGGSVTLWINDVGKIKIVRHHQRKNGHASIFLESGEAISEDNLSEWLKGVSRELYDAIFCFDLDGLKGIDQLKPAELNHFLFSAGMMGNAELFDMEKRLEKEAGDLFKSGGRNPVINQTISELNTLRVKMTSWENQMDEYQAQKNETAVLAEELIKLEAKRKQLEQEKRDFIKFKACESLLIDYQKLKEEIAALKDAAQFPENGKERYDHWRTLAVSLQGELSDTEQKMKDLQDSFSELEEDDPILQYEREIIALGRENNERGTWERELTKLGEQIRIEKETIRAALEQLNMSGSDYESIKEIQVSLSSKQSLKEWMNKWQDALTRKSAIEMAVEEETGKIQSSKEKKIALTSHLMPDEEFKALELQFNDYQHGRMDLEKERLNRELSSLKRGKEINQLLGRIKMVIPVGQLILFIALSSILILTGNRLTGFIVMGTSVVLAVALAIFLQSLQKRFKQAGNERELIRQLQELETKDPQDISQSLYLYNQEKSKRDQLSILSVQMDDGKRRFNALIKKLEQINLEMAEIEAGIHDWREHMGLSVCEIAILPEVYQLTEKVREQIFRLESLEKQTADYQMLLNDFNNKLEEISRKLGQQGMTLGECDTRLEQAKIQKAKKDKLLETLNHLKETRGSLNEKAVRYYKECQNLIEQAGVTTEEEFYHLNNLADERAAQQERLHGLERQLMHMVPQEEVRNQYFKWLTAGYWAGHEENDYITQIDGVDGRIKQIQKQESDIQSNLAQMEKDETYADLLHEYEEKRYFLNQEAKKWGTIHIALSLLKQAKEDYRQTRLPKVLESASVYLHQITNRIYKKIYYTESEGFTLETSDGAIFSAGQLSRGTGEQLYLSLRLALVDVYKTPVNLPIIVDDGFVNFDATRRRQVIDVLKEVSNNRQVLLFTCHRYKTKDILELSVKNVGGEWEHVGPVISDSAR
jgi:uncharacterized protein YhaN